MDRDIQYFVNTTLALVLGSLFLITMYDALRYGNGYSSLYFNQFGEMWIEFVVAHIIVIYLIICLIIKWREG